MICARRLTFGLAAVAVAVPAAPVLAKAPQPPRATATATGSGGAIATVDPYASKAGLDVLRRGGTAVDAAVAAASVLGVVEPYSSGIGGGGFMVIYDAKTKRTDTIDGRETAPAAFPATAFVDPATGQPYPSSAFRELATSGLAVGVPGTVRTWELALRRYGTRSLRSLMQRSIELADRGFVVDRTLSQQTTENLDRFNDFTSTRAVYTVDGKAPAAGSVLRNPDLARTLKAIAKDGGRALHTGAIARDIVATVRKPPLVPGSTRNARPGVMTLADLQGYKALRRAPVTTTYRGLKVVGMGPPSSGGSTIGEALEILEGFSPLGADPAQARHRYLEASKLAYADRGKYLGDPGKVKVPLTGLLSSPFAAERRALIGEQAATAPVAAGNPWPYEPGGQPAGAVTGRGDAQEGPSTTHLTVRDRRGTVVSYTFTIEQTGGSGIVVPGRGFLLNNELTDFDFATGAPNSPAGGKRPRSSMSPTIVLRGGRPWLALGSPGGSTIITTVLQTLVNRIDLRMPLPMALAAPRLSQRNAATVETEPGFPESADGVALATRGQAFKVSPEIGALAAIEVLADGRVRAAAEPRRRGGGSAMVEPRRARARKGR